MLYFLTEDKLFTQIIHLCVRHCFSVCLAACFCEQEVFLSTPVVCGLIIILPYHVSIPLFSIATTQDKQMLGSGTCGTATTFQKFRTFGKFCHILTQDNVIPPKNFRVFIKTALVFRLWRSRGVFMVDGVLLVACLALVRSAISARDGFYLDRVWDYDIYLLLGCFFLHLFHFIFKILDLG